MPAQPVDATPPDIKLFPRGGVHDAKTMEAVFGPTGRYVGPLEGWAIVTCDWSSARQGSTRHPFSAGASWWDRSAGPSPVAACADVGRARRHLAGDRHRLLDAAIAQG